MNKSSAVALYGTQKLISEALGISFQAVSQWPELVPKGAALELEKLTNGALVCDLSLYGPRKRATKKHTGDEA